MKAYCRLLGLGLVLSLCDIFITSTTNNALAQNITLDGTLGNAQTLNGPDYTIPQSVGTTVGSNLFHSFGQFSLNSSETASFQSDANIRNIFSRVTGGSPSIIKGGISTESTSVNFFFINPSGIIFGPNTQLAVGGSTRGSFIATTADALVWSNGSQFSAKNPGGTSSLLTIVGDPSGFLFNTRLPKPIQVFDNQLVVFEGQSLLLLGGNVNLNNSFLFVEPTEGGRIELGSVAEPGIVGLNTNGNILSLNFPENLARADVSLNGTFLDATAGNAGSIAINARNINILDGSQLLAGIASNLGEVNSQAGDVTLNATGAIKVEQGSRIESSVNQGAIGNAGNINITAASVSVKGGAQILARNSRGRGNAGSVTITATDTVSIAGSEGNFGATVGTDVADRGIGNGNNINITAPTVLITDEAIVAASIIDGTGENGRAAQAGNVIINASKMFSVANNATVFSEVGSNSNGYGGSININAPNANVLLENGGSLITQIRAGGRGQAGDINVTTGSLTVKGGSQLSANTSGRGSAGDIKITATSSVAFDGFGRNRFGSNDLFINGNRVSPSAALSTVESRGVGNGGNIELTTPNLSLTGGAQLLTSSSGQGNAGNIRIDTHNGEVKISGSNSGLVAQTNSGSTGDSGSIFTQARTLLIQDGARVSVDSQGTGVGGNIQINTTNLTLSNQALLSAETASTQGGNINIQNQRLLLLRHNSRISTNAGNSQAGGNGGNITITSPNGFIVAVPSENSDITANAFIGNGGKVEITAKSIFGIQPQVFDTLQSDITASSESGIDGVVSINTPDIDPSRGLVVLTANLVDSSGMVEQGCSEFNNLTDNQLSITGRGGLPPNPNEVLSSDVVWSDTRLSTFPTQAQVSRKVLDIKNFVPNSDTAPMLTATGWVFNNKGEVTLVSHTPNATAESFKSYSASCSRR